MEESSSVHKYDKIFRENIEPIFLALAERSLGLSIAKKKVLVDKIVSTAVREVDSLYEITTTEGEKIILHVEIQTDNDVQMVYRIGEYHGMISKKYKLPIKHIVIYLGEKRTTILRLNEICKSKNSLKKFTSQLLVLSKLRNLEKQALSKINDMTQLFDVTTSILFQQGEEKGQKIGQKIGHAGGLVQGMEQGELKNKMIVIANMLTKSDLSTSQITDLVEVDEAFVLDIKEKLDGSEWPHPDTWSDNQWDIYFEKKQDDNSEK